MSKESFQKCYEDRSEAPQRSEYGDCSNNARAKTRMIELGDAFIALPGGVGTLEEISEIVSLTRIGLVNKPTVFYNVDGYYESLKDQFDRMVQEEFLKLEVREMFLFSESLQEIDTFIREHS